MVPRHLESTLVREVVHSTGQLVITGATGWVGRTALHELQKLLPHHLLVERVRLFASRSGSVWIDATDVNPGFALPVYSLATLPELAVSHPVSAVLHTAFLTRDRLEDVGHEYYLACNRWITSQVAQALNLSPKARAVVISSGAATLYDNHSDPLACLDFDPYGVLKHEEEITLASLAPGLVLRIYALSGRFIRDPQRFALGDFLLSALRGEAIHLRSQQPVLRSFGHAGDITGMAWRWLFSDQEPMCLPLAAVSLGLDLLSLAGRITDQYHLPPVAAAIDPMAQPDCYVADPQPFLAALAHHGLRPASLDQQLRDTAAGLVEVANPRLFR